MDRLKEQLKELILKLIDDANNDDYSWYIKHFNKKNPRLYMTKLIIQLIDQATNNDYSFIIKYNKKMRREKLKDDRDKLYLAIKEKYPNISIEQIEKEIMSKVEE